MFERKEINKILNKMGFLKWSQQLNKITNANLNNLCIDNKIKEIIKKYL